MLGISFKTDAGDFRESPMLKTVERLHGSGYDIRVYDPNGSRAAVEGTNRPYILNVLPHIYRMLTVDISAFLQHSKTIVVANKSNAFQSVLEGLRPHQSVVDLARCLPATDRSVNAASLGRHVANAMAA